MSEERHALRAGYGQDAEGYQRQGGAMVVGDCSWARPADADPFWPTCSRTTARWAIQANRRRRPRRSARRTFPPKPPSSSLWCGNGCAPWATRR